MKFFSVSRLLSVCLAFGLLLGTSLPSFASSGLYVPTSDDIDMFLEGFEPTNPEDPTSGLFDYFNEYFPSPLGNVNDDTGVTSYSIRYYAGLGYGGWSSETNWTTSSNVAVNKTFSASDVTGSLPRSGLNLKTLANSQYFQPSIGYTISFLRAEQEPFVKGSKVNMVLEFSDTCVSSNVLGINYINESYSSTTTNSFSSMYGSSTSNNMLDLATSNSDSNFTIIGYNNVVTIGCVSTSGEYFEIDTTNNIKNLDVNVVIPEDDIQYLVVDVEYNAKNIKTSSSTSTRQWFYTPLVFNFDLSGNITLEEGSINTGLLQGIIEWLRSILNAIIELPQNIVDLLKNALNELFVPSPDFISGKFEEFKLLAESKLGFLFTMLDMVVELFTTLSTNIATPSETLTIPSLRLPFSYVDGGQIVLWNDMTFSVFPEGLDVLKNLCHLVTSIVLITATISYCVTYVRNFFEKE